MGGNARPSSTVRLLFPEPVCQQKQIVCGPIFVAPDGLRALVPKSLGCLEIVLALYEKMGVSEKIVQVETIDAVYSRTVAMEGTIAFDDPSTQIKLIQLTDPKSTFAQQIRRQE